MITGALLAVLPALSPAFEELCAPCHGPGGRGDGPAAALYLPRPRDLAVETLRNGERPEDLARTLHEGIVATGMPSFARVSSDDRARLVQDVLALRALGDRAPKRVGDTLWPTRPLPALPTGGELPIFDTPSAHACGRCHPRAFEQWSTSRHALAFGDGVELQTPDAATARAESCRTCHAPMSEQSTQPDLRREGVTCAACHRRDGAKLSRRPAAGDRATGLPVQVEADFGRAVQCLPCHNLPIEGAVAGKPLLDTFREWAASPYLPARIPCQTCHFADADHRLRGAHDPEAVRSAVSLALTTIGETLVASVRNVGAGHAFPTTATPRVVLRLRQLDAEGAPVAGTEALWAIGRTVTSEDGGRRWTQVADTRIAPGETRRWPYERPRARTARALEAELFMYPDWFYAGAFRSRAAADPAFRGVADQAAASGFRVTGARLPWPPAR